MVKNIKKVPFPDFLLTADCEIVLDEKELDENGKPKKSAPIKAKCMWSECLRRAYDKDGKDVTLLGQVIVKGDIAPAQKEISSGTVTINKRKMYIFSAARAKNPDGTVHHTEFKLQ